MKEIDATYDPTANPFTPIEPGSYPAHIVDYNTRDVKTKVGDAIVINLTYEVADEAGELVQICYEMDGYEYKKDEAGNKIAIKDADGKTKTVQCKHLVGKKFRDNGTFVFTGSENSSRNRRYFDLLSTLGVSLKEDSNDVVGLPVFVKLNSEEYEKDGEVRTAWKVFNVQQWDNGQKKSAEEIDEDLPF